MVSLSYRLLMISFGKILQDVIAIVYLISVVTFYDLLLLSSSSRPLEKILLTVSTSHTPSSATCRTNLQTSLI